MFADVLSDLGPVERNEAIVAVDRLFDAFDEDGNGVVDTREFFAGVAVLCGGDGEDRTRMAFQLYDTECALLLPPLRLAAAARPPLRTYTRYVLTRGRRGSGDGFISPSEMEQYLTAVFRTMRHTSPGVFREQGCDEPTDAGPRAWRDPCPDALPSPPRRPACLPVSWPAPRRSTASRRRTPQGVSRTLPLPAALPCPL